MKGAVFKRCGCRNPATGKVYAEGKCPDLEKKKHGSWWARYDAPASADGKRRRPRIGPFPTKTAAEDALADELVKAGKTGHASDRALKVGPYLDRWLAGKVDLKDSTRESYEEAVNLYLKPGLGHLRLVDLRDYHASELYAEMLFINRPLPDGEKPSELMRRLMAARADSVKKKLAAGEKRGKKSTKPLSPARVKRVHAVLSSALGSAVKKSKLLDSNPVEHVELPRAPRPKPLVWTAGRVARWEQTGKAPSPVMVWTPAQTGAFLDFIAAAEERLYAMFHLVAFRGLRRAEVAGLPRGERDREAGTITIRETRPDDDLDPDDTKSEHGDRTVTLDAGTVEVLDEWEARQDDERRVAGEVWQETGLMFTREDGSALRPEWISQRFEAHMERYAMIRQRHAGGWTVAEIAKRHRLPAEAVRVAIDGDPLPPIRFHDLRHGAATLSLAAGVDMKIISETLGHSRSSFTADVYTSVIPQVAKAAAEATATVVPRRTGPTMAPQDDDSALAEVIDFRERAGRRAEDRGFEPRMGVNPNRISSAAP
ncbi:tyrosine-type recombinase/integrase [Actinomadura fulvescens]|uniref:Tyrosine-type recombinase/integrase n=1 Tax=Actinomadura fulvescens TaxID=46160 RepID=A0ABP6CPQ4_9ACTN